MLCHTPRISKASQRHLVIFLDRQDGRGAVFHGGDALGDGLGGGDGGDQRNAPPDRAGADGAFVGLALLAGEGIDDHVNGVVDHVIDDIRAAFIDLLHQRR